MRQGCRGKWSVKSALRSAIFAEAFVSASVLAAATPPVVAQNDATYAESVIHKFRGNPDGQSPEADLVLDANGKIYGTTVAGGSNPNCPGGFGQGCGTVFSLDGTGKEQVIYSFAGKPDGASSFAGLLADAAGHLYGTTALGGNVAGCYSGGGDGCGTVFKLDTSGNETVLHDFRSVFKGKPDGQSPEGVLVADAAGNLYGTTPFGGPNSAGTIFKVHPGGSETVLYFFTGNSDGARPYSGVIRDAKGNLFGVTYFGGLSGCTGGCGTVFEFNTASGVLTTLYAFTGQADGGNPYGGLIQDRAGNFYGTTELNGDNQCSGGNGPGCGVVFELSPAGVETVLHAFTGSPDGRNPYTRLVMDDHGNLFGTTTFGGDSSCNKGYSCGVVYEVRRTGKEIVLHAFTGGRKDGEVPYGGLARDAAGNLYGTTVSGGTGACSGRCGTVFKLVPTIPGGQGEERRN